MNACSSLCGFVMDLQSVHGVPHPSHGDSWSTSGTCDPEIKKRLKIMDGCPNLINLVIFKQEF